MKAIDVICAVFADGSVFFTDDVSDQGRRIVAAWKAIQSPERMAALQDAGAMNGLLMLRMLPEDYQRIQANNGPLTMAYLDSMNAGSGVG